MTVKPVYTMKNVNGHVEIFDFYHRFICSGDNEKDALEGYYEVMESCKETVSAQTDARQ